MTTTEHTTPYPAEGSTQESPYSRPCGASSKEEIGVDVVPGDVLFVREWIDPERAIHQVEFIFRVSAPRITRLAPTVPDGDQIGADWLPLAAIASCRLYPLEMRQVLPVLAGATVPPAVYLGYGR